MEKDAKKKQEQLEAIENGTTKQLARKRVDIVSIKLVKESSLLYKGRTIRSPQEGFDLAKQYLGDVDREHFIIVCLDTKNTPTCINTAHIGSLNASIVSIREVFKTAIVSNSASIIAFHNHPSGNPEPSREDKEVTQRLVEAGKIIGIDVLDHIILGDDSFVSLKEKGYI
ncbi:RadC family protein [Actinomycetes bacterium NPDC127524]